MQKNWIVVADSAGARIFTVAAPGGRLEEVEALVHPESRMHAREVTSDLPGRAFDSAGKGRHAMESEVGPKKQEAIAFARQLAKRLHSALAHGEADQFILVAAPDFLGLLRDALEPAVRKRVDMELDLNLVRMKPTEIRAHLPEKLFSML